jgi:hypothetical protein
MDAVINFAKATVDSAGYDSSVTEINLLAGGERLPTLCNAVWWNATDYPDPSDDPGVEIIRITDNDGFTLTVERGKEFTSAQDHNLSGKTYKIMQAFTRQTILDLVGNVFNSANPYIAVDIPNDNIEITSDQVLIGDVQGAGNSGTLAVVDPDGVVVFSNIDLATTQSVSATGPVGTVVGKLPIKDATGTLLGYLPIYSSIT